MCVAMLHHAGPADVSSPRCCVSGGASLPVEVLHAFEARYGATVLEGYGLSETSPVAGVNHPDAERRPGTIGTPVRGCGMDLRAADGSVPPTGEVGEIVVRGEDVMEGHWRNHTATAPAVDEDGWFRTGDLAVRDAEGCYRVVDRAKDMIDRAGYERVPARGRGGRRRRRLGGGATGTEDELREHVRAALAAYEHPRLITIVTELPEGPTGKVLEREIAPTLVQDPVEEETPA